VVEHDVTDTGQQVLRLVAAQNTGNHRLLLIVSRLTATEHVLVVVDAEAVRAELARVQQALGQVGAGQQLLRTRRAGYVVLIVLVDGVIDEVTADRVLRVDGLEADRALVEERQVGGGVFEAEGLVGRKVGKGHGGGDVLEGLVGLCGRGGGSGGDGGCVDLVPVEIEVGVE
jgi:hypothetical protein